MNLGRLILTHRQDLILPIKNFYLPPRSNFLVIAYNKNNVDVSKFEQSGNFKLLLYTGRGPGGTIAGQQFFVWASVARTFPNIDAWVCHDYDVLVKPSDIGIFNNIPEGSYGSIGSPFYNWQKNLPQPTATNIFPWKNHYTRSTNVKDSTFLGVEEFLLKYYPLEYNGIKTVKTAYGDFIAAYSKDLLMFEDNRLYEITDGGGEQVPATVMAYRGVKPVDLRQFFSMEISLDNTLYVPFKNKFDIAHTVKFWPQGNARPGFKLALKRFIKYWVTPSKYRQSWPDKVKT